MENNESRSKEIQEGFEHSLLLQEVLNQARNHISTPTFDTFFSDLSIEVINKEKIIFGTNTKMKVDWINARYKKLLTTLLKTITNVDYEVSVIVGEHSTEIIDNSNENIDDKNYEELWERAFGNLEQQKALYLKRISKADYDISDLNIIQCVLCGNDEVPNVDLDVELETINTRIKSIKIRGGKCSNCGEQYYDSSDLKAIEEIKKTLDELFQDSN